MAFPSPQEILKQVQGGSTTAPLIPASTKTTLPTPQAVLTQSKVGSEQPSFLKNLATAAGKLYTSIGEAIYKPAEKFATDLGYYQQDLKVTPSTVLTGIKDASIGTAKAADFLAKGFNEGVARIIKSTSVATIGEKATEKIANAGGPVSLGELSKATTGRDSIATYQQIYDKAQSYAVDENASINQAKAFASLTVIGAIFADNPAFGPGKNTAWFKLSEQATKDMVKATTDDAVRVILKAENPALKEAELDAIVPVFRNAGSEGEVRAAADQIIHIQKAPLSKGAAASDVPSPEDVLRVSKENMDAVATKAVDTVTPEPSAGGLFRAITEPDNTIRYMPVDGQPVKIIDGLDTFVYQPEHGAYEVLEASTGRQIGNMAETPEAAIKSAQDALQGRKLEDILASIQREKTNVPREVQGISTGSPQAVKAAERGLVPAAPRPFDQNLVRAISEETTPGPILDRMTQAFPNVSDHALAPIAKRLSQLKRTGDIEGILQVVRNISEDISAARAAAKATPLPIPITKETLDKSIAKVSDKKAVGDLPPAVGQLLTPEERGKYLDSIGRVVRNKEDAVLAQQEYNALWEHADQRVIDRYEELRIQRDMLDEYLNQSEGKQLNDLYKGTFISPVDVSLDELIVKKKGIDSKIGEIMGTASQPGVVDVTEHAQKMLDQWRASRTHLAEIKQEMRELRPKVKAARILQSMVEDVPVIARKEAGDIESLASFEDVRTYKDISGFSGQARDVYRNFEHVFGDKFAEVKRVILDPFDKSKGEMVDTLTQIGDDLEKNVVKGLGIKKGSKESAAVQLFGEGKLSEEELARRVGKDRVDAVRKADAYFRGRYDQFLVRVNQVRAEIFPNDPTKLIQRRKDYYHHFQELSDGFKALVDLFETPAGIDPQLAGISEWTKPKSKFLAFAQERLGKETTEDAVGGFLHYAPAYAYAIHIDPHIGKFRYLRRRLAESAPTPGVREVVPAADAAAADIGATELVKQPGLNNFLEYLDDFSNDLAGKTNPMDRYVQKIIPGGRKTFRVINWVNKRIKANTILGNLSSAIAQVFNVPNGVASAKLYSIPGIKRTLSSILAPNDPMLRSAFIKERFQGDISSRFMVDWLEHPGTGTTERAKALAVWITQAGDEIGTKFIWNSHFEKGLAEGVTDPIKYADDMTRKLVAGRGIGEVPLIQKSKIFQLVAPFQLEVGNAWYVLGGFVKRKDFGAVATLLLANYLMNRAAEEIRGTPVVFDPIESLFDGVTQASDEMDDGNYGRAAFKFTGRQVGELLSNIPLGQTVAAAVPENFVKSTLGFQGGKKELFGSADPGRFGSGLLILSGVQDPLYRILPAFSGMQVKRTIDGIESMITGKVTDKSGRTSFETSPNAMSVAKAVLFGKNATDEARSFYDTRDDLFQRIYRQDASRQDVHIQAESIWAEVKGMQKADAISRLQELEKTDPAMADAVAQIAQDEKTGLSGTERLIKMLGVENGERAKFISDAISGDVPGISLKTREDQIRFLQELDDKKLISDTVFQQLMVLLPGKIKSK